MMGKQQQMLRAGQQAWRRQQRPETDTPTTKGQHGEDNAGITAGARRPTLGWGRKADTSPDH